MGSAKYPQPEQPQATPKATDPAVQEAIAESVRRKAAGRGYRSTIIRNRMMDSGQQQTFGA